MPDKKEIPTKPEIDAAARNYLQAKEELRKVQDAVDTHADLLIQMVKDHGFLPPRATKTRRLQGEIYKIDVSKSQCVEVDGTSVLRFRAALETLGMLGWFTKFFRRVWVFVLAEDAQSALTRLLSRVEKLNALGRLPSDLKDRDFAKLFADAAGIKDKSPSLSVEPIKKQKEDGNVT